MKAGKEGAYNTLLDLLEAKLKAYSQEQSAHIEKLLVKTLNTLTALMDMQPDLLDETGINVIKRYGSFIFQSLDCFSCKMIKFI